MAAWLTIYCACPLHQIGVEEIRTAISAADLHTDAEAFGIEEDEVDSALAQLKIEPADGMGGVKARIRYQSPESRPVEVHIFPAGGDISEELEEAQEALEECSWEGRSRVEEHLKRAIEVALVQLGWSQIKDMGIVLATTVADFLAEIGEGIIRDNNDDWWAVEEGVPVLICTRRK